MITFEKDEEHYKVLFKKQLISKKVEKMATSETFKKSKRNRKKNKEKKQTPRNDSPFSLLEVLIKN